MDKVAALTPGSGFLNLAAGARGTGSAWTAFARGEVGWHLAPSASLFAFAEADKAFGSPLEWQAGVAAKATW